MSFSMSYNDLAPTVRVQVRKDPNNTPASIRDYVIAGIDALVFTFGDDVRVGVSVSGHLHSEGNDTTTSVSVNVYKVP